MTTPPDPGAPRPEDAEPLEPRGSWEVVDPGGPGPHPPATEAGPGWTGASGSWSAAGARITVVRLRPGWLLAFVLLWACLGCGAVGFLLWLGSRAWS